MPVRFTRLRIAGFKSFPDAVTLEILPGLTGIVGPNGCGKSNVVEALRWAMGEASARSLRGGEMDDVIFAGTSHRPSRNLAEVTIGLDGTQGLAPPPFHEAPELEVSRRIERGVGSTFRVNGREARARDVQTLFADLATGARASAMVSQGRVAAIVNARPDERRSILEEAAGITGLHARRHEAELKLRAAEANLARACDLRGQLDVQLEGLQRQTRQAARFRTIGELVRAAEAELLAIQRALAERARGHARATLAEADGAVVAAVAAATQATTTATATAAALPPLRIHDAESRTNLERARIAAEQVTAEAARAEAALAAATQRRNQVARDLAHAERAQRQAADARERLAGEDRDLEMREASAPAEIAAARIVAAQAAQALEAAEAASQAAIEQAAVLGARHGAATSALEAARERARRMASQSAALLADRARAAALAVSDDEIAASADARYRAEAQRGAAVATLEATELAVQAARRDAGSARESAGRAEAERMKLAAAAQGLAEALDANGARGAGLIDQLAVPEGLEAALAAALGDSLEASTDPADARHWRELPPWQPPPPFLSGPTLLSDRIDEGLLGRALSQVGLVDDVAAGEAMQPGLRPGQTLVSREGDFWRWDGLRARAGAPSAAAIRLRQRNRLAELRESLVAAEARARQLLCARGEAEAAERAAFAAEQSGRAEARRAEQDFARVRDHESELQRRAATAAARLEALDEALTRASAEQAQAEAALVRATQEQAALTDPAQARALADHARSALASARQREAAARAARDALARSAEASARRRGTLQAEMQDWSLRDRDAKERLTDLAARAAEADQELRECQDAPATLIVARAAALELAEAAEAAQRRASDRLQVAETEAGAADRALRAAEHALSAAREQRVRLEGEATRADAAWGVVAERIVERLGATPALPDPPANLDAEAEERGRRRLDKLLREREGMGPVNLRAEIEAAEIAERAETIVREATELSSAIAKLRGSIGHINREGRERLGQVFADIDRHFRALFETMFGGGRAHLAMVGSDDPLLAGLEIYAQPPGKKLATLSLLSGGEQALTALSLIFAVFRCNPAPVCVLDEVDAPLDDANVERFCGLLEAIVRDTGTRFLVVTHHPVTMARMDRLYGVTMQERGVSRLLSVDLARAAAMVEPERLAAE